jgi:hypothetical protein
MAAAAVVVIPRVMTMAVTAVVELRRGAWLKRSMTSSVTVRARVAPLVGTTLVVIRRTALMMIVVAAMVEVAGVREVAVVTAAAVTDTECRY